MAYYLNNEREKDVFNAYRNYQVYLQSLKSTFPPSTFTLAQPNGIKTQMIIGVHMTLGLKD